ncbi:hypothetical protein JCM30760_21100 [Thiomicrorhabdus hydrogeniphila]
MNNNIVQINVNKNNDISKHVTKILSQHEVMPFHDSLLPGQLYQWVEDNARRANMPPDYLGASLIASLSILISYKFKVAPKSLDDWLVTPNLWGMAIGDPSMGKTPMLKKSMSLINGLEPKSRLIVHDSTIEKLAETLSQQDHGVLLFRDELSGLFQSMNKRGREMDRAFYLEGFNGDSPYDTDRVKRGSIHIESLCISIMGGIQPDAINPLINATIKGQLNDGLLQRFQLMVWPEPLKRKYYDAKPDNEAQNFMQELFELLWDKLQISENKVLRFSPETQQKFKDFYENHETQGGLDSFEPALEEHFNKYSSLLPSIALIFQIIENFDSEFISLKNFQYALNWVEYLASHAKKVYSKNSNLTDKALTIYRNKNQLKHSFSASDVKRKGWSGLKDINFISEVLDLLTQQSILGIQKIDTNNVGRPKKSRYYWKV